MSNAAYKSSMNNLELCEEIGSFFGDYYVDSYGRLTIDTGDEIHTYNSAEELLKDWADTLIESDEAQQDDYWADVIDYIRDLD